MSTIDKMLIKGIRSFSPDNKTVIEFYKPLTLIVGANGAGKTTIIECLKHACTGELPPNARSGHTFVHDPKVAGETETKGQIKLRFKTTAGRDVVCIRSFQLTQKASKLEYKAVESVLQTIDPRSGEKVALSYRCADMDREVPSLMGVPKAVLENVIFVHQDEANWPLAEAAVLKKKFDEIFSATRYTKALEVIKKLHKEQAQQVKEYKLKLDHLQTLKDAAFKLNSDIDTDNSKSAALQSKIKELEQKIAERQSRIDNIKSALRKMQAWQNDIEVKEGTRAVLARQRDQLYNALEEESDESTEELRTFQEDFAKTVAGMRIQAAKLERQLTDAQMQDQSEKENFNRLQLMKGKLQAEAETCNNDRQDRDRLIQALAAKHGIAVEGATPFPDQAASAFFDKARQQLEQLQRSLQQMKAVNKRRDDELTSNWESLRSQFLKADGSISLKMQQKADNEDKLEGFGRLLQDGPAIERAFEETAERVEELQAEYNRKAEEAEREKYDEKIQDVDRELLAVRQRMADLQKEKDQMNAETADRVQLRIKKQDLQEKEKSYKQIMSEQQARLKKAFHGRVPEAPRLLAEMKSLTNSSRSQYEAVKQKSDDEAKKVAILEERHRAAAKTLTTLEREMERTKAFLMSNLRGLLDGDYELNEFKEAKEDTEKDALTAKANFAVVQASEPLYQRYIDGAKKQHICVVCEKGLNSREEIAFVSKYENQKRTIGDQMVQCQRMSENAQRTLDAIRDLEPQYFAFADLQEKKLPAAERDVQSIEAELEKAREKSNDAALELSSTEVEFKEVEKLEGIATTVDRLVQEAAALQDRIKDQEFKLETLSQAARSVADINTELEKLEDDRETLERKRKRIQEKKERDNSEVSAAQTRWRNARDESFQANIQKNRLDDVRRQREETEASINSLGIEIQVLQQKLGPLQREQDALLRHRDTHRETAQREEAAEDEKGRAMQRDVDQLRAVNGKISKYLLAGGETRLRETLEKITRCVANQKAYEETISELGEKLKELNKQVQAQDTIKRNIDDNLNYRSVRDEERRLASEIDELQQKVVAAGDDTGLTEEINRGQSDRDTMNDEANRLRGTVSAYEGNIKRNRTELKDPRYADIENRYRNQLIQLKTTEMANKDLDKYYHALDKALMRFHSMKMEEINKIIKELWQQTYRGQDIDYIEIRSDAETTSSARSYAYRVVMRSGDAELDMRGRCSAGQKVLASLVIRLALAETFCLNCGILALDEPTTNLDTPNAESLAGALSRIMQDRKTQQNFQLIVITHDERFAQLIGHREYAEKYYRISKNEHQHSHIEVQDIFD